VSNESDSEKSQEVGTQPKDQAEALLSKPFLIPRNPIALTLRFILVVFLVDFGFAIILALLSNIVLGAGRGLFILIAIVVLLKLAVVIGFLVWMTSRWAGISYYINDRQLIYNRGIANIQEDNYELENVRRVHLDQDFLGRMFDYGHLRLTITTPELSINFVLYDLKDPRHYKSLFEKFLGTPGEF
jgi:uncharacterized membrane protein YdbT with pleckstrin-like domain